MKKNEKKPRMMLPWPLASNELQMGRKSHAASDMMTALESWAEVTMNVTT